MHTYYYTLSIGLYITTLVTVVRRVYAIQKREKYQTELDLYKITYYIFFMTQCVTLFYSCQFKRSKLEET